MCVRLILSLAMMLTGVVPALAQVTCTEPAPPPPIDGAQASADQLRGAMAQAHDFMAQSEAFQACLTQSDDPDARTKVAASQKAEETVGRSVSSAVDTYKRAHAN